MMIFFIQDQSHCTDTGFTTVENRSKPLFLKELKKIWEYLESTLQLNKGEYNESNTLLLDDSPYKALCNPVCFIVLSNFSPCGCVTGFALGGILTPFFI